MVSLYILSTSTLWSFKAADSSMDSMSMEITHVWNTPGKGSFLRECVVIKSLPIGHYLIMAA